CVAARSRPPTFGAAPKRGPAPIAVTLAPPRPCVQLGPVECLGQALPSARSHRGEGMIEADLIVVNASGVATCTEAPGREGSIGLLEKGAVAVRDGEIVWVGPEAQLPFKVRTL